MPGSHEGERDGVKCQNNVFCNLCIARKGGTTRVCKCLLSPLGVLSTHDQTSLIVWCCEWGWLRS